MISMKKANHTVLHTQVIDPVNRVTIYHHSIAASIRGSDITFTSPYRVSVEYKQRPIPIWAPLNARAKRRNTYPRTLVGRSL